MRFAFLQPVQLRFVRQIYLAHFDSILLIQNPKPNRGRSSGASKFFMDCTRHDDPPIQLKKDIGDTKYYGIVDW